MTACNHITLELLPQKKNRVRCRYCHLTIDVEELGDGCCPECFEMDGTKRYDFKEMEAEEKGLARYRCVECGIIVANEQRPPKDEETIL